MKDLVSVPYGDHVCLNGYQFRMMHTVNCFRPLWGSCLSQWRLVIFIPVVLIVSVPYGDHVCLNRFIIEIHK